MKKILTLGLISLTLVIPLHSQTTVAPPNEAELRALATRFYHSMEPQTGPEFYSLWSSQSTDEESKPPKSSRWESKRVESLTIQGFTISGETAKVHVKVHMSAVLKPDVKPFDSYFNNDALLTLRCVKESGVWKVMQHVSTFEDEADELVESIINAPTNDVRVTLLKSKPELPNPMIMSSLFFKADQIREYDFEKWLDLMQFQIQTATQSGEFQSLADLYNMMAVSYSSRGDQSTALEYYLKSLEAADRIDTTKKRANNYVWGNLGTIYAEQGNYPQALAAYQRGLNPDKPQAWVLQNIAETYKNMGDYAHALETLNKALASAEALKPNSGRDQAIAGVLTGIGRLYQAQGNYSQALEYFERAITLAETAKPQRNTADILNSLAKIYLAQGNPQRAVQTVERAMATPRRETSGPGADTEILPTAGRAYRETGAFDRAREMLTRAIAGSEYRRSHAAGGEQGRQQYFEQLIASYHEMIKLLVDEKNVNEAFAYAERSKARALLDVIESGRGEINKSLTPEELKQDAELRRKIAMLNLELQSVMRGPQADPTRMQAMEKSLEQARLEYESFQTNLYSLHPELRVNRAELKPISVSETAELLLNANTALLQFVVTDEQTFLFVITKDVFSTQPLLKLYPIKLEQNELKRRVEGYRDELAKRSPEFHKSARELFDLLLGSALPQLQGKHQLIVVPDGVLWNLPFQALESEKRRFLIEESSIFYAPSFTALREIVRQGSTGKTLNKIDLLALGNPVNGVRVKDRIRTGLMDYALEPLPEAEQQVSSLAKLYGPGKSKVYIGAAATEDRAKIEAPSSRVIQFATHGILNSRNPMYSHLVLSQANSDEDGLLEAWEIMKLDLHADMVVLAACETARGRVGAGEGMIGMSWAFFVAGSPTTVASQWKVESASTTQLMLEFHRNLKANTQGVRISKAKALQLAALKLLKSPKYRHPFYWAGFVVLGDGF